MKQYLFNNIIIVVALLSVCSCNNDYQYPDLSNATPIYSIKDINSENDTKELVSIEKDPNALLKILIELFEKTKKLTGAKIVNSFKSCALGQLMICHNIIKYTKNFDEDIHTYIKDIISIMKIQVNMILFLVVIVLIRILML